MTSDDRETRELLVCEVSGGLPIAGACPLHNGDRCLVFLDAERVESKRALFREAVEGLHRAYGPNGDHS